jgi:hypothetical protein
MKKEDRIRDAYSPLLDGELSDEEREAIEEELAGEADLLRELEGLRQVDRAYRGLDDGAAPAGFEAGVAQEIARQKAGIQKRRAVMRVFVPTLAAAAVVIVVAGTFLLQPEKRSAQLAMAPVTESPERHAEEFRVAADAAAPTVQSAPPRSAPSPAPVARGRRALSDQAAATAPVREAGDRRVADLAEAEAAPLDGSQPRAAAGAEEKTTANSLRALGYLGSAAEAKDESAMTITEDWRFEKRDGIWFQAEYAEEDTESLARDSARLSTLIPDENIRTRIAALDGAVVFRAEGAWYRLEAAAASR